MIIRYGCRPQHTYIVIDSKMLHLNLVVPTLQVQILAIIGLTAASYALYVENKLDENPFYKPACETSWGSCSTV